MTAIFLKPILTIVLISIIFGLIGVFVVWKKIAYFGDSISHSMLLAVVLGALWQMNQNLTFLSYAFIYGILSATILHSEIFSRDSLMMILSYFAIALAFLIRDFFLTNLDFSSYIFGDLMMVGTNEVLALSLLTIFVIIFTFCFHKKILMININQDLTKIKGYKIILTNIIFSALLIITIALTIQIVGIFLVTALLILPASIARIFARSPQQMLTLSLIVAIIFSLGAFKIAESYDLTVSASIVMTLISVFIVGLTLKKLITIFYEKY